MSIVEYISEVSHADLDAVKLILSILAAYPMAFLYRIFIKRLPSELHSVYFLVFGLVIYFWNFEYQVANPLLGVLANYCVLHFFPGTRLSIAFTFIFNTGHLLGGYSLKHYSDHVYSICWTTAQCVLTLRLIGLTWDIFDAHQAQKKKNEPSVPLPSLLHVYGFCFHPASFLVGPQFGIFHYMALVEGRLDVPKTKRKFLHVDQRFYRGFLRFCMGVVYIAIYSIGSLYFQLSFLNSDEFLHNWNVISRLLYITILMKITLMRYIGVWLLTEGACIVCGLGNTGEITPDGFQKTHDMCANVRIREFEFCTSLQGVINSFNVNTNKWALQYVYKRLRFLNSKAISQGVTLGYLSIWHGLHSGYHFTFFLEFFYMYIENDVKSVSKRLSVDSLLTTWWARIIYLIVMKFYVLFSCGMALVPFTLLDLHKWLEVYRAVYYVNLIHILWFIARPVVIHAFGGRQPKHKVAQKEE